VVVDFFCFSFLEKLKKVGSPKQQKFLMELFFVAEEMLRGKLAKTRLLQALRTLT
jgi:hypothetical protein